MKKSLLLIASLALAGCASDPGSQSPGAGGMVKITSLGSHDGELCPLDRAIMFEDPDGTRILYDAGRTVRGPSDPRLGKIDAIQTVPVLWWVARTMLYFMGRKNSWNLWRLLSCH